MLRKGQISEIWLRIEATLASLEEKRTRKSKVLKAPAVVRGPSFLHCSTEQRTCCQTRDRKESYFIKNKQPFSTLIAINPVAGYSNAVCDPEKMQNWAAFRRSRSRLAPLSSEKETAGNSRPTRLFIGLFLRPALLCSSS